MEAGANRGRSPSGQPWWAQPALIVVAVLAAALYTWNIGRSDFVPYYSAAVRSVSESWPAFLFGAFDPAGSITLDKIPGFLWPQALSARIFGFHAWALTLPQVIEGVVTVLVLYRAVRRLGAGPPPGAAARPPRRERRGAGVGSRLVGGGPRGPAGRGGAPRPRRRPPGGCGGEGFHAVPRPPRDEGEVHACVPLWFA